MTNERSTFSTSIGRQRLELAERGVADAEVVDRHADAELAQALERLRAFSMSATTALSVTSRHSRPGRRPESASAAATSSGKRVEEAGAARR